MAHECIGTGSFTTLAVDEDLEHAEVKISVAVTKIKNIASVLNLEEFEAIEFGVAEDDDFENLRFTLEFHHSS